MRGSHLVNWATVTSPKNFGGLGLRDSRLANAALLGKWAWRILNEPPQGLVSINIARIWFAYYVYDKTLLILVFPIYGT